jgi:hypothetical protein
VWSVGVVVDPPFFDDLTCFLEVGEQVLVETLVAQPAVETLDQRVFNGLPWPNEVELDAAPVGPLVEGLRDEWSTVIDVGNDRDWAACSSASTTLCPVSDTLVSRHPLSRLD